MNDRGVQYGIICGQKRGGGKYVTEWCFKHSIEYGKTYIQETDRNVRKEGQGTRDEGDGRSPFHG